MFSKFIKRDYKRNENDDFKLNIAREIGELEEALPQYYNGILVGWKIQARYE